MFRILVMAALMCGFFVPYAHAAECTAAKTWSAEVLTYTDLNSVVNGLVTCVNYIDSDKLSTLTNTVDIDISTNVIGIDIDKTASGSGSPIDINDAGSAASILINKTGTGNAFTITQ